MSQSNSERMVPNALSSGNQQHKSAPNNSSAGNKSPDVQVVDVRWPVVEREYDGNGKQVSERIIAHGRSFHQQQEKIQPVLVSVFNSRGIEVYFIFQKLTYSLI